jgi:NitT/TauT family transport system ATP-binding protein
MADRIVVMGGANPAHVRTIVQNRLARPRDYRSAEFGRLVDQLYQIITGSELPDVPVAAAARTPSLIEPLPYVSPGEIVGLLEYLDARGGQDDVFRIAATTHREFGQVITVVKAAEMLNLVDTPKSLVVLEPDGRRFVQLSPERRKVAWRVQLLKLALFREVHDALRRQRKRTVDREFVLETIVLHLPQENYERVFETFIQWARFGELLTYDEETGSITTYSRRRRRGPEPQPAGTPAGESSAEDSAAAPSATAPEPPVPPQE